AVSGGVMAAGLASGLRELGPQVDVQAVISGGMEAVADLPAAARPAIEEAFRHAITGTFEMGGIVMALACVVALTLRGTEFGEPAAGQ
ncbi:hypothetical protein, partial [Poseidonocella sp. HB161398]|uniref:hypothetical protein n=1 Tax=Poseidonocella sp. HB161398 TaxID=2320855 RepID=UPI00197F6145